MPGDLAQDTVERVPHAMRSTSNAGLDVFCAVKQLMSSTSLSQPPLLVVPGSLVSESQRFLQVANSTSKMLTVSYEKERLDEIAKIAKALRFDFPHMRRAIAWYESILRGEGSWEETYPQLTFLRNAPVQGPSIHDLHIGPRPELPRPHNLQVVFHR